MTTKYPNLFAPIQIGQTMVRNRIFIPPMCTNLSHDGYVTKELVAHYAARA